jgi:hypothetical protein
MYRVRVYHTTYGCDTGCCGHIVEITDGKDKFETDFEFFHPDKGEDLKEWATRLAKKRIGKNFPECMDSIDWDTLDYEKVTDE